MDTSSVWSLMDDMGNRSVITEEDADRMFTFIQGFAGGSHSYITRDSGTTEEYEDRLEALEMCLDTLKGLKKRKVIKDNKEDLNGYGVTTHELRNVIVVYKNILGGKKRGRN